MLREVTLEFKQIYKYITHYNTQRCVKYVTQYNKQIKKTIFFFVHSNEWVHIEIETFDTIDQTVLYYFLQFVYFCIVFNGSNYIEFVILCHSYHQSNDVAIVHPLDYLQLLLLIHAFAVRSIPFAIMASLTIQHYFRIPRMSPYLSENQNRFFFVILATICVYYWMNRGNEENRILNTVGKKNSI